MMAVITGEIEIIANEIRRPRESISERAPSDTATTAIVENGSAAVTHCLRATLRLPRRRTCEVRSQPYFPPDDGPRAAWRANLLAARHAADLIATCRRACDRRPSS